MIKENENLSRKDLHKYYKYVKVCLTCKKQYGTDINSAPSQCSQCSGRYKSLTFKDKKKEKIKKQEGLMVTVTNDNKLKGGIG